ncbi:hypothetical protein [Pseudaestuariivita rosea]|uniref:hypothetical protein n=1 Tax=Pseudaestuariivita rosea TaxID=2763263 RepID=UPI001ABB1D21
MTQKTGGAGDALTCWVIAGIVSFFVLILLMFFGGWSFLQAAFGASLVFLVGGGLLTWVMLRPLPQPGEINPNRAGEAPTAGSAAPVSDAAPTPRPEAAKRTVQHAANATATTEEVVEEPVAEEVSPAPEPIASPPVDEPAAIEQSQPEPVTEAPKKRPVAADGKPELLDEPRDGKADDLKQIKGVGPKLEALLHSKGIYHFDQIASWRKKEVDWVDENLEGFKGRVTRDEWVKQAKLLAKGEQTEFSKKVKKGGVY